MKVILYYFFLAFTLLLSINVFLCISSKTPKKIRNIIRFMILIIIVRYIGLIYVGITDSNNTVLMLKPIKNLNMIFVPGILMLASYVFFRNNKQKITSIYPFLGIFIGIYAALLCFSKYALSIGKDFGFLLISSNSIMEYFVFCVILEFIFLLILYNIGKPYVNKLGLFTEIIAISVNVAEAFMFIFGKAIFPVPVLGEFLTLLIVYYINQTFVR